MLVSPSLLFCEFDHRITVVQRSSLPCLRRFPSDGSRSLFALAELNPGVI